MGENMENSGKNIPEDTRIPRGVHADTHGRLIIDVDYAEECEENTQKMDEKRRRREDRPWMGRSRCRGKEQL